MTRLRPWLPLLLVLLAAALLRFWKLAEIPPGLQFDEAHNALDAARLIDGARELFFTDNGGREPLSIYAYALALAGLGREQPTLALRLVSALVGLATIALLFGFVRRVFADRRLALLAAGFLAFSYWHLHFSRFGIRAIFAPLWTTLAIWGWWRAVASAEDGEGGARTWLPGALLCGASMAAAVYSHPTGRLIPLILLADALYRTLVARARARRAWLALGTAGLAAALLCLPLGLAFLRRPGSFTGHPSDVSILAVAAADHGGSLARALAGQVGAIAGMLFVAGDPSTFHNLPGLPVFDPLSALLAVLGLGIALAALVWGDADRRERAVLLGAWLAVMLLPTLLSDRPPNYSRAIAALPVIALLPALGLRWTIAALDLRWSSGEQLGLRPGIQRGLAAGVLALAGLWTAYHYFVVFAQRTPHVYYSYDAEKHDAWRALAERAASAEIFLHPLWAEQATIAFLNAEGPLRKLDPTGALVLPDDGRDALFAFPAKEAEREGWAERFEAAFGALAIREDLVDAQGQPLLVTYRVASDAAGDLAPPTDAPLEPEVWTSARFGGRIDLLGYTVEGPARPGEPLPIRLWWRALEPVGQDLTLFLHLQGPDGEPLGQEDREPAAASYRTGDWIPGELLVDRFEPRLAPEARGPITVALGWYDPATGERLPVNDTDAFRLKPIPLEER